VTICRRCCNGWGGFALPSVLSIAVTYTVLRFTQRDSLSQEVMAAEVDVPGLSSSGRMTACGNRGHGNRASACLRLRG